MNKKKNLAAICDDGKIKFDSVPYPVSKENEVTLKVLTVGLCRTDFYAIDGLIPAKKNLIPGHEFVGEIVEIGRGVDEQLFGKRVAVNPVLPCGVCSSCITGDLENCLDGNFLGVDSNGCLTNYLTLPVSNVFPVPETMSNYQAAYAEPVAASLAPERLNELKNEKGLIFGRNRISNLTHQVLKAIGFRSLQIDVPERGGYDFVIETSLEDCSIEQLINCVKPKGTIVLKSRTYKDIPFPVKKLLQRQIKILSVYYGRFQKAVDLLDTTLNIDNLIGRTFSVSELVEAITYAKKNPEKKTFIQVSE